MRFYAAISVCVILGLASVLACAPGTSDGRAVAPAERAQAPKILTVAVQGEPVGFVDVGDTRAGAATGTRYAKILAHNLLTVPNEQSALVAQLATEVISVENDTWRVNPDGSMDTTWKLRPGVRWHDGEPFTSEDLLFSFEVFKDPAIPNIVGRAIRLMDSARAPDAHTLEIHWSDVFSTADQAPGLTPLPRHLLRELYERDKEGFINTPLLTTGWVGLGAFRLTTWEPGSHMQFERFDGYFGGRALVESVIVRWLGDPNTMLANIMAEAVDAVLPLGVRIDDALDLKHRWQGTGHQVVADLSGRLRHLEIQHRAEWAKPTAAMTNHQVRQAVYQSIDRRGLADLMNPGLNSPIADSWIPPGHELRAPLESHIPQFPYDPARAQQTLVQNGWTRGSGGSLVHQQTGEPFRLHTWNTQSSGAEREMGSVAENWKSVGIDMEVYIVPTALLSDREARAKLPGVGFTGAGYESFWEERLHSRNGTGPANRWTGSNRGGYANPNSDLVLDKLQTTIARAERLELHKQLLKEQLADIAIMPLYWDLDPVIFLRNVKGIVYPSGSVSEIVTQWDKE